SGRWCVDLDLNLVANDANGKATDFDPAIVHPGAIFQPKMPGMPGTGDDAVFHPSRAERGAHVRTAIVDGEVLAVMQEQGDEVPAHDDGLPIAFLYLANSANGVILCHEHPRLITPVRATIILNEKIQKRKRAACHREKLWLKLNRNSLLPISQR